METIIEVAKQQGIIVYKGIANSDNDLPLEPKHGDLYVADNEWESKILNNNINYGDSLIYSEVNGWNIVKNISESVWINDEDIIETKEK